MDRHSKTNMICRKVIGFLIEFSYSTLPTLIILAILSSKLGYIPNTFPILGGLSQIVEGMTLVIVTMFPSINLIDYILSMDLFNIIGTINAILLVGLVRAISICLIKIYLNGKKKGGVLFTTIKFIVIYFILTIVLIQIIEYGDIEIIDMLNEKYTYNPYPNLKLEPEATITYKIFKLIMILTYLVLLARNLVSSKLKINYRNKNTSLIGNRENRVDTLDDNKYYVRLFFRNWINYVFLYGFPLAFVVPIIRKDGRGVADILLNTN